MNFFLIYFFYLDPLKICSESMRCYPRTVGSPEYLSVTRGCHLPPPQLVLAHYKGLAGRLA